MIIAKRELPYKGAMQTLGQLNCATKTSLCENEDVKFCNRDTGEKEWSDKSGGHPSQGRIFLTSRIPAYAEFI